MSYTMLRTMDLFSGIGGFSLGLKKAGGFRTVAYCEIEPYCRQVLHARMSDGSLDTAPICADVTKLDGEPWCGLVDLLCGGFPCQDISNAGRQAGIGGERSGLWSEIARLVREIRPRYVLVENVAALLGRGLGDVLRDLAAVGYDAEWDCIPASAVGAPHRRDRIWIVAYPERGGRGPEGIFSLGGAMGQWRDSADLSPETKDAGIGQVVAHAAQAGRQDVQGCKESAQFPGLRASGRSSWWDVEPAVGRVADGVPRRVDRIGALGNAVVPQVVEWIGRRIMKAQS